MSAVSVSGHSDFDILDAPTPAFIEEMRRRFPTERETDAQLVRKLERRAGPPYTPVTLSELADGIRRLLADTIACDFEISNARWFTGGASKIQMGFDLRWYVPGRGPSLDRMMLRMDPAESHTPPASCGSSSCCGRCRSGAVSGLGTNFGPELRAVLGPQYLEYLAAIHTFDPRGASLSSFDVPLLGTTQSAQWELNRARRIWEEDRGEDFPLMEVAANWLARNLPTLDHVSVVHGDYRSGNFLFDETSERITGWLEWERGHLGDRHRDLAWSTQPVCGHYAEDGVTYLVCGLVPLGSFYRDYERVSGLPVDPERLQWYRILNSYSMTVSTLASAYRVVRLGKTHQDVLLARVGGMFPVVAAELSALLEEVL